MNKIATIVFDVVDEIVSGDVEKLAQMVEPLSDSAKMAYIPSLEEQSTKNERDFGLVLWSPQIGQLRKYALYTPELVEINLEYLSSKATELPEEIVKTASHNLTAAAKKYNITIPSNLEKYSSDTFTDNSIDLREIDETKYILKNASAPKTNYFALGSVKKYPIDTNMQIKKASAYFEKNHKKMDFKDVLEFSVNVREAAERNEVSLDKTAINKYASLDFDNFNSDLYNHVEVRKSYLRDNDDEVKSLYNNLLEKCDELGPTKTATVLYEIDKKAELVGNYHHGLEDPLFATLANSGESDTKEVDGVLIKSSQLDSIPSGDLTAIVGNDTIDELRGDEKLDVLASLPRPIRQELLDLM